MSHYNNRISVKIGSEWVGYEGNVKVTGVRQSGLSGLTMIKYDNLETGLWAEKNFKLFVDSFICVSEHQDSALLQERMNDGLESVAVEIAKRESAVQDIKVGSVWRGREDGDLVYVISTDGSTWNIIFNSLDDEHEYANDTEGFLKQYAFVCDSRSALDDELGSVAIKELWKANCDGTVCEVVDIEVDDGVTWIVTQSVDDKDAVECDRVGDFFKSYEFFSSEMPKQQKSPICNHCNRDYTGHQLEVTCMDENNNCQMCRAALSGKFCTGQSTAPNQHGHYHKDTSAYDTMDIYAICKVWDVEPSGCTFAAVKKLLNGGERGSKSRLTDLQQAIESVERLIQLEFPEHGEISNHK